MFEITPFVCETLHKDRILLHADSGAKTNGNKKIKVDITNKYV